MIKSLEETGRVIRINAQSFGDELCAVSAIVDLLDKDAECREIGSETIVSDFHRHNLLRAIGVLSSRSYDRLIFAIGNESALTLGVHATLEAEQKLQESTRGTK